MNQPTIRTLSLGAGVQSTTIYLRGSMFLHRSRVPLDQAPIDRVTRREWTDRQGDLFDEVEDGDPDGCSPWTCRSGLPVSASDRTEDAA